MNKTQLFIVGAAFLIVLIGIFMVYSPVPRNDLEFGRMVFKGLITGDGSMDEHIDWSRVKMMGLDVAAQHASYAEPEARDVFRKALIKNLSVSFTQTGGKMSDFTDWRVHEKQGDIAVLAADYDKKDSVLLVKVTLVEGERKLIGIEWLSTAAVSEDLPESQENAQNQ